MVQKKYRQNILLVTEVINLVSKEIYQTPVTFIVLFIGGVDCNILTFFWHITESNYSQLWLLAPVLVRIVR